MLADGRLDVGPLISHRFGIGEAEGAYAVVGGAEPSLGILVEYPGSAQDAVLRERTVVFPSPQPLSPEGEGLQMEWSALLGRATMPRRY